MQGYSTSWSPSIVKNSHCYFLGALILVYTHQGIFPVLNIDTQTNKNSYLSSDHIQIELGTPSFPPQTRHIPQPLSSPYFCFPLLYAPPSSRPFTLQETLLLHHTLCNCDKIWDHGGLGAGESLSILVANIKCAVDLFFDCKLITTKNRRKQKIYRALITKGQTLAQFEKEYIPSDCTSDTKI